MHEMSIAQAIAEIVCQHADEYRGASGANEEVIDCIRLRVGKYRAIVPDSLSFCLELILEETPAARARIEIQEIPIQIHCNNCETDTELEYPYPICPECNSYDVEIIAGKELELESIGWASKPASNAMTD